MKIKELIKKLEKLNPEKEIGLSITCGPCCESWTEWKGNLKISKYNCDWQKEHKNYIIEYE